MDGLLVARRGRLLEIVEVWDGAMAHSFAVACVISARDVAVEALRECGRIVDAGPLATVEALDVLQAAAMTLAAGTSGFAGDALAFLVDAVELVNGGRPDSYGEHPRCISRPTAGAIAANLGFVAAHIMGCGAAHLTRSAAGYQAGFDNERARQRAWLTERGIARHGGLMQSFGSRNETVRT